MMSDLDLLRLREEIQQLSPVEQLRLAAELLDKGKSELAESIAGDVVDKLKLARLLRK